MHSALRHPSPALLSAVSGLLSLALSTACGPIQSSGGAAGAVADSEEGRTPRTPATCVVVPASRLAPASGALLGVSIDWHHDSLAAYAERLGHRPAVAVTFSALPMSASDAAGVDAAVDQVAAEGGILLLTLEPDSGLESVTPAVATDLARRLASYNERGVPVIVRFAHEMNGSWYAWGQQPQTYVRVFRTVAATVHRDAPGSAMMWAPNYGGGYPFPVGAHTARRGTAAMRALDTNGNGRLDARDDSYAPYYPGDDAVDWVGISLYHWGTKYPWGENEVPSAKKFASMLTGTYQASGVDERSVPNFYGIYGKAHSKPVAITETAALYAPGRGGAEETQIKAAWWRQVFAPSIAARFPNLKMVNWFELDKEEAEISGRVDWSATRSGSTRDAFRRAIPSWARFGGDSPRC